jgi:hypothetical protein
MKVLHLAEEAEKALAQVVDAALKAGGLQMHHVVAFLFTHIKDDAAVPPVVPPVQE